MPKPNSKPGEFILFKTDEAGPDLASVAEHVTAAPDVTLLRQSQAGLLVEGVAKSVKRLIDSLPGWQSEPNQRARGGV